jgi:hypothetical protein
LKSSPNVIKKFTQCHKKIHPRRKNKSTQCPLGWLEKGLNRNRQRVHIISLMPFLF